MLINNTQAHVKNIHGRIILPPGVSDVDPRVWDDATTVTVKGGEKKNHPMIQHWLDAGEIVVQNKSEKRQSLSDLTVKSAVALVEQTLTADLLKLWSETEKRKGVVDALKAQLELLKPQEKDDGE